MDHEVVLGDASLDQLTAWLQMRAKWVVTAGLIMAAAPLARGAERITASNWQRHPDIVEIRAIHRKIKQAEDAGRLRKLQRTFEHCRSCEDTERVLYLDARGAVRSSHFGGGSEDSVAQHAHYYDRDGKLRFVFIKAGAVNGTRLEYRISFESRQATVGGAKAPERSRLDIS